MHSIINKQKGTIYGQAIGDALGLGTEFMNDGFMRLAYPNGLRHYDEIYQDMHRSRWQKGAWTDDTDMMLCIARAIVKDKQVNPEIRQSVALSFRIVDRIHDILQEKGLKQKVLALRLGKSEAEISKWMRGTHNFTIDTLVSIEEALDATIVQVYHPYTYT